MLYARPELQCRQAICPPTQPCTTPRSSRSSPSKLFQIRPRRNTQHKSSPFIRNDSEFLLPRLSVLPAVEEQLQLLQWCVHRDDFVHSALPPELDHRLGDLVCFLHLAGFEKNLQVWDGEVA